MRCQSSLKKSPKRDTKLEEIKNELEPETPGFRVLCPTRWTVRACSLQSVQYNYASLQQRWEYCLTVFKSRHRYQGKDDTSNLNKDRVSSRLRNFYQAYGDHDSWYHGESRNDVNDYYDKARQV